MPHTADVLVVGGGPAGACTAWALASRGVRVTVLDRARFPRDKPCSEYLSPQASRILDAMGVLRSLEDQGASQLRGMTVRAPSGDRIHGEFAGAHGFRGFRDRGLAIPRRVLDATLLECARQAGATVLEGVRVNDVHADAHGRVRGVVTGERRAPQLHSARLVIGADGLRSVVARRLGLTRATGWPRRIAFVCHMKGVADVGPYGEMHVEHDGYLGVADLGGGVTNIALVVPSRFAHVEHGDKAAFMDAWIAKRPHLARRFGCAGRVTPVAATGPFASSTRRAWARGAALVGDAADFFDPFTGEGIYAALRGAELLVPRAMDALAPAISLRARDEALAAYDAERKREFSGKWKVERLVAVAVAFPWIMNRAARVLSRRRDMADLLVGVVGDFVPPREVLRPSYVLPLLLPLPR